MFLKFQPFFLISETPVHPGSGTELGAVDLPIQREKHTNFPKIEGSGLKGSIREVFENSEQDIELGGHKIKLKDNISLIFGPDKREGEEHAGALAFMDAKILLFPVKSLKGIFAWITCPQVIERFKEDMRKAGYGEEVKGFEAKPNTLPESNNLAISSKIVLEEYTFEVFSNERTGEIAEWLAEKIFPAGEEDVYRYWREKLKKDLVILPDDEFREFVSMSTEIVARTVIDDNTGTAKNLWYEEYLPQDTILYSIAMASAVNVDEDKKGIFKGENSEKEAEKVIEYFKKGIRDLQFIQIGGNRTVGKGLVRVQMF